MKDLLIHTSNKKVDILIPNKVPGYPEPCIFFSLNQFISYFGEYVYLFEKDILEKNFFVESNPTRGVEYSVKLGFEKEYRYNSKDLGQEFKIYQPIDIQRYCMGIIINFNYLKGTLEKRIKSEIIRREEIDFFNR